MILILLSRKGLAMMESLDDFVCALREVSVLFARKREWKRCCGAQSLALFSAFNMSVKHKRFKRKHMLAEFYCNTF